jgi:spermidine synthase
MALSHLAGLPMIAGVAMGIGAMAAYARPEQRMDFYELDPATFEIAEKYFFYLSMGRGQLHYIFGDGRLSLLRAKDSRYDLIVLDAFNSDAIPVHLVTVEAIIEYRARLRPDGLLLVHISNRYLELTPILFANAKSLKLHCLYKSNEGFKNPLAEVSEWVILTSNAGASQALVSRLHWTDLDLQPPALTVQPWTDRYSNILPAIFMKEVVEP